jgi:FkbM family methyltransferase
MDNSNYFNKIKEWDEFHCEKHVINFVNQIYNLLDKNNFTNINYIDIGANVGKVYDLLSTKIMINKAYLYEASPILYSYLEKKYENNSLVKTYNIAISEDLGNVFFDESSLIHQINNGFTDLNLGLSKITNNQNLTKIDSTKISIILNQNKDLFRDINFIKIDTENVDFYILKDLLTVVDLFDNKPIIEFEVNYFMNGHSQMWAQEIIDEFINHGYNKLNLSDCYGEGILIPSTFKI